MIGDPMGELSCREMVELVSTYLDGGLAAHDRALFEAHLAMCDGCSAYLDQMRRTLAVVGSLREESVDPAVRERLLHAFRDWKRRS
jgi:predicted anti-sigma-YlaC factor YlaD